MAEQFVIPQFLEVESKIMGPITVRQFVILMVVGLILVIYNRLFDFSLFLILSVPTFTIGVAFAFYKPYGQPLHFVVLNIIQTLRKPSIRVWNKLKSDNELRAHLKQKTKPLPPPPYKKPPLSGSHLRDLSLVVNTGGMYVPDQTKKEK